MKFRRLNQKNNDEVPVQWKPLIRGVKVGGLWLLLAAAEALNCRVRAVREVRVWGPSFDKAQRFAERHSAAGRPVTAMNTSRDVVHLSRTSPCVKDPAAEPLVLPPDLVSLVHESARIDPEFCEQHEDEAVQLLETFVGLVNEMEGRQQNLFAA